MAFLMLPQGKVFKFHDHPGMNGFSKCAFGEIKVKALNIKILQEKEGILSYPKEEVRT